MAVHSRTTLLFRRRMEVMNGAPPSQQTEGPSETSTESISHRPLVAPSSRTNSNETCWVEPAETGTSNCDTIQPRDEPEKNMLEVPNLKVPPAFKLMS